MLGGAGDPPECKRGTPTLAGRNPPWRGRSRSAPIVCMGDRSNSTPRSPAVLRQLRKKGGVRRVAARTVSGPRLVAAGSAPGDRRGNETEKGELPLARADGSVGGVRSAVPFLASQAGRGLPPLRVKHEPIIDLRSGERTRWI